MEEQKKPVGRPAQSQPGILGSLQVAILEFLKACRPRKVSKLECAVGVQVGHVVRNGVDAKSQDLTMWTVPFMGVSIKSNKDQSIDKLISIGNIKEITFESE